MANMTNQSQAADPSDNGRASGDGGGRIESVTRNEAGQLVVRMAGGGEPLTDVRVARCFPWSLPQAYISVRNKDGREIVLLQTLDELDPSSRALVQEELRDKVFHPKILRIVDYKREFGVTSVIADTDRGQVIFQIRSRDDVRILSPTRLLFRDADGNTYEVADAAALDASSRKFVEEYF